MIKRLEQMLGRPLNVFEVRLTRNLESDYTAGAQMIVEDLFEAVFEAGKQAGKGERDE